VSTILTEATMTILDRALDTGRIRIDATRFTDELARRLPDGDQFDITRARETAGVAVHDAADRARDSIDHAAELVRVLRSDIAHAAEKGQADNKLDEVGQRLRAVASTTAIRALIARLERELPDTDRDRYAIAYARGRAQGRSRYLIVGIAAGVTAGIVAAALLEPRHGKERRDRIGGKVGSLTAGLSTRAASTAKIAQDRARGIAVERGLVKPEAGTAVTVAIDETIGKSGGPVVVDTAAIVVDADAAVTPDVAANAAEAVVVAADAPSPTA
jgi:gas vesicle protein